MSRFIYRILYKIDGIYCAIADKVEDWMRVIEDWVCGKDTVLNQDDFWIGGISPNEYLEAIRDKEKVNWQKEGF